MKNNEETKYTIYQNISYVTKVIYIIILYFL